jgi:hypothetical protein
VEQQSLEQQAKAWLETRERVVRSSQELRAQGWSISDRGEVIHPDCLEEPLRSEVLRQMRLVRTQEAVTCSPVVG